MAIRSRIAAAAMLSALAVGLTATPAPANSDPALAEATGKNLDSLHFAWAGVTDRSAGHYYRIQGKTFVVEFDNTQNNANHIHTVWRNFTGDFGHDLLAEHYARDHGKKS